LFTLVPAQPVVALKRTTATGVALSICDSGNGHSSEPASAPAAPRQRDGNGDGRVYHISFTATNTIGRSCTGAVTVGVPHDQGPNGGPVDEGALFDSTQP
jgi:hypothetical protein